VDRQRSGARQGLGGAVIGPEAAAAAEDDQIGAGQGNEFPDRRNVVGQWRVTLRDTAVARDQRRQHRRVEIGGRLQLAADCRQPYDRVPNDRNIGHSERRQESGIGRTHQPASRQQDRSGSDIVAPTFNPIALGYRRNQFDCSGVGTGLFDRDDGVGPFRHRVAG
jgi:hypothetical protein